GTVRDAYTGKPVAAANVSLLQTGGSAPRWQQATDPSGSYNATSWAAQDTLQIAASGYEPLAITLESQPQLAKPTPPAVTLDAVLRPNTLVGLVADKAAGKPLAGARVSVALDATRTLSATTDTAGRYRIEGVPAEFKLAVNAVDYEPISVDVSRTTTQDVALRPNTLSGVITDRFSGVPVAGAKIAALKGSARGAEATTDAEGRYKLENVAADATAVEVAAEGYAQLSQQVGSTTMLDAVLRPDVLKGAVVDKATGKPIANATIMATTTLPGTDVAFVRIDGSKDGSFTLEGIPESGYVQVLAPGYVKAVLKLEPGKVPATIALEPFEAKALYITAAVASSGPKLLNQYFDLIDQSELNAIIVDLKSDLRDDLGTIYYDSQVPLVKELGTARDYVDMGAFLAEAKKRGIYTIARVQVFSHDNALADARPEWAIKDAATGKVYADLPGPGIRYAWLDPWNKNVWNYNIQLSVEAVQMGFDEINYDYIRYPDGNPATYSSEYVFSQPTDPKKNPDAMYQNIASFLKESQRAINGAGAYLSIDVFGRTVLAPSMPIAQDMALFANYSDYVGPMIYPSLFWGNYLDFEYPVDHPYEVVKGSVESGQKLMAGKYGLLRPWLQAHTDPWAAKVVKYGDKEIRAQIDAAEEAGNAGWMLYNSANIYEEGPLKPAQ
ncbi:MAG: carboxypeptidase regulatory-like domain-containing protein, partial [Cytophagales bacterium]|nr:carboxypeptidase regulatory-like domain-containing protein [Rhizobacter sp.]